MVLSHRAQKLKTSPTLFLVAKAKELQAQGHDVISLTVGEPDWATYPVAAEAGIAAIKNGFTKYTAAQGTIELRRAIIQRTKEDLSQDYTLSEVTVTSGAKYAIFAALQVLCDPSDEVIIHSPYWVSYPAMVELADAVPRIITCHEKDHFKLTASELEKNINNNTKALLFCSPSNPTGFVYTKAELQKLAEVLLKYPRVHIITDDMYHRLMFDGTLRAPHILDVAPALKDRTIIINGASKAYAMTGWRIGWALGPKQIIQALGDYASQSTGAPCSISQAAALPVIQEAEKEIAETNLNLKKRLQAALTEFKTLPEFKIFEPQGAFYFWVDVTQVIGKYYQGIKIESSQDFGKILLEKFFVATVPGEEFGNPGYLRLSFAIETKRMTEAIGRMKALVKELTLG